MSPSKNHKYNQLIVGWLIGMVSPIIILLITYQLNFSDVEFLSFLQNIWRMGIFMKLLSVCAFPNLGFFFLFYRLKYDLSARGVILATFIYAFAVLIVKLI
jgi:uncharacterized BrkB/YihY/UPF0761 family membrane protein